MTVKSKQILEQIKSKDKALLTTNKNLIRKFGNEEDCVELHIYDLNGNLLKSVYDFTQYEIPSVTNFENVFSEITFNPDKVLRDLGFFMGEYKLRVNFHRRKVTNNFTDIFYINDISPSRTELRVKLKDTKNINFLKRKTDEFIASLQDTVNDLPYFKDFALNLGNDIILTGVNFISEPNEANSFLIKLYEPLPNSLSSKTPFRIIEELTNPIEYKLKLEPTNQFEIPSTELRGPNLRINTRLNSSVPSPYKAYNDILKYESSGSLNNILNALSSSIPVSVEFDNPNTNTGYTFEKFTHFSSAKERLENFKYKLELIELYTSKSAYAESLNSNFAATSDVKHYENLKQKVVGGFDPFERYLYFESGTYAWPKNTSTTSKPYINQSVTSSDSLTWFGSTNVNGTYYGGYITSASNFDDENPYILRNSLPQYIIDNTQNEQYITFIDMVGQYFDNIWLYIENITDKNIAHNSLTEGISKDLVFHALQEKGIPAFNQFENSNLFEYLIGSYTGSDSFIYQAPSGQTMVTASNESMPKGDITKEIWKRLYHNTPYLLKTKGTERGIKALLSCYGIPHGLLHVKEYGGASISSGSNFQDFRYPKLEGALNIKGVNTNNFLEFQIPANGTVEFTILANKVDRNVLLTDRTNFSNLSIYSSSLHDESGTIQFEDLALAKSLDQPAPYYAGRPITFYIKSVGGPGVYEIIASIFIDGQHIEKVGTRTFQGSTLALGVQGADVPELNDISSSFAVHHFKVYDDTLDLSTRKQHTKDPGMLAINNNTSSYFDDTLLYYSPLGADGEQEDLTSATNASPYSFKNYAYGSGKSSYAIKALKPIDYIDITYDHFMATPDTIGSSMVSEKTRYDEGEVDGTILTPFIKSEVSSLDRHPLDTSTLGVFFSPTFEVNEDIVHTLGGFRLDDYIGDPRHLNSGSYPDLKQIRNHYKQKTTSGYNFWDYLKTIQYFDHTIFKIIEEFVPAKANLKTGFVIEPNYLQRPKINLNSTDFSNISIEEQNIDIAPTLDSEYILYTSPGDSAGSASISIMEVFSGSYGSFENNFTYGTISSKYWI